jgi:hypothetical protein
VFFALRDKNHEFSMNLVTVLKILYFAEHEGFVPELPKEWKTKIDQRYDLWGDGYEYDDV